jgi:ribosome-associated heat shock protein Hsp15
MERSCQHAGMEDRSAPVRVDKWLWAARLVKTRAIAHEMATGGLVHVNGRGIRPGKDVRPGDRLELTTGPIRRIVVIRATAGRRLPASEAVELYEETPESIAARERLAEQRRLEAQAFGAASRPGGARPTKRDRRRMDRAARGRG